MTPPSKSRTSTATWRWARKPFRPSWTARSRFRARFCFHALHLHRFHPYVFSIRRGEILVRSAGRSRQLRHAGFLHVVAHDRADAGHVSPELGRRISRRGARRRKDGFLPPLSTGL